jgi:hypothetical protein
MHEGFWTFGTFWSFEDMTTETTSKKKPKDPTVEDLRKQGWKVRVYHARSVTKYTQEGTEHLMMSKRELEEDINQDGGESGYYLESTGGFTRLEFKAPTGEEYTTKFNVPFGHQFNRKRGLTACIGRMLRSK